MVSNIKGIIIPIISFIKEILGDAKYFKCPNRCKSLQTGANHCAATIFNI